MRHRRLERTLPSHLDGRFCPPLDYRKAFFAIEIKGGYH